MKLVKSFADLLPLLPELSPGTRVWLPAQLAKTLPRQPEALLDAPTRLLLGEVGTPVRDGYVDWLAAGRLQTLIGESTGTPLAATLRRYFGRATPRLEAPASPPPVAWPDLPDTAARLAWYRQCLAAYAGTLHAMRCQPMSLFELDLLEDTLGCAIPPLLREYWHQLGYPDLAESLIVPEPLLAFYPGIDDILDALPAADAARERGVVDALVAFGDYLGNGNGWCFHRQTGAVWYFDHDSPPHWQPMFPRIEDYLDSLMLMSLMQDTDGDIDETPFRQRFGDTLVQKWMY